MPEIADHPIADQLAREWVALRPADQVCCISCGKLFAIAGIDGTGSLLCPHCGFLPGEECCKQVLKGLQQRASEPATPAPATQTNDPPEKVDSPGLDDVIGNRAAVLQIRTALDAHRARLGKIDGRTQAARATVFPHMLLAGPGGTGKTMLATIIAREIKRPLRTQMGQSLNSPAKVASMLLDLKGGDVLFIDEIHGLKPACQETLYRAMEEGILIPITKASQPPGAPIKLPPFTLIGATTDRWGLQSPFLQRFKYLIRLERMSAAELAQSIIQCAALRGWSVTAEASAMIADRALGTPRLGLRLLDGCMDVALASGESAIDAMIVQSTCEILVIDRLGLDAIARKYLTYLADAGGAPVRLNVLAMKLDERRRTVEMGVEPDLVWLGMVEKQANGRVLTAAGREHLRGT